MEAGATIVSRLMGKRFRLGSTCGSPTHNRERYSTTSSELRTDYPDWQCQIVDRIPTRCHTEPFQADWESGTGIDRGKSSNRWVKTRKVTPTRRDSA